jgi:POT family proton-dependent oligopeptide transporter
MTAALLDDAARGKRWHSARPMTSLAPVAEPTTFGGHPRGLRTLFFTEMWERFSYYGMRAILILYLTAAVAGGGLGFDNEHAGAVYGWYTSLVYLTALPGGFIADRFLGQRRSVLVGGIIIALGHFSLAIPSLPFFYLGLALIVAGTGFLKPNVSTMVGSLYAPNDPRRDGGFSIFYMGINLGAFIAPLVVGYFAQDASFLGWLRDHGIDPRHAWHVAFSIAGLGMLIGVIQFAMGKRNFGPAVEGPREQTAAQREQSKEPLSREDWSRLSAIAVLFVFSALFWSAFEQAGSSLNLFADRLTDNRILGHAFPSSWFQSLQPLFIIGLAPLFAWLWVALARRGSEPSSPAKFAWGLFWVGTGFLVVAWGAVVAQRSGLASPWFLFFVYLFHTFGELCLSPVGLSTVTKLAPKRLSSLMMGVWFTSMAVGNKAGGFIAGHFDPHGSLPQLFLIVAGFTIIPAGVLVLLLKPIRKLMAGAH